MAASSMEPKPIITIDGELELIGPVLQKTLQTKLKALQRDGYTKEEFAFSSMCNGVKFMTKFRGSQYRPGFLHELPCLHTYWTGCADTGTYNGILRKDIEQWMKDVKTTEGSNAMVIVYCVTAEVRSKRSRLHKGKLEHVEEMITKEFKNEDCSIINLKLASAYPNRIADSFLSFASEINRISLSEFLRSVSSEDDRLLKSIRRHTVPSDKFYNYICQKLSLAISYEMIRNPTKAKLIYSSTHDDLETTITMLAQDTDKPDWLQNIFKAALKKWDYPRLMEPQQSWKYLSVILSNQAHLLHIWTLLFTRRVHILCGTGNTNQLQPCCLQVSECCVQTLHCIARVINILKVNLPDGVFNSWAYMTCLECVESMMVLVDTEVLANTPSAILILIRAELWHYAWEKLRSIGLLCNLMPGLVMGDDNHKTVDVICSGITLPMFEEAQENDQGKRLTDVLKSKEKFKNTFMSLGEMVIGAFKHAGRRRMAFSIGTMMAEFHKDVGLVKEAEHLLCDVTSLHSVGQWPQLSSSAYSILAHCQKSLKQEDKEVNSLLVLVTTPNHLNSDHNPSHCMDQLIYIAERSKYQKLLSWEPLFDLDTLSTEPVGCLEYHSGEDVGMKFSFHYYGPKAMRLTMLSVILENENTNRSVPMVTDRHTHPIDSSEPLEEITLNPGPVEERLRDSRPIGGDQGSKLHKVYYSSSHLDGDSLDNGITVTPGLHLISNAMTIEPGMNTVTVTGKINTPGTYTPYHIILKSGALDFCLVVPSQPAKQSTITVLPDKVDITVALLPQVNVMLAGVPVLAQLRINTGEETSINDGAELTIKAPNAIELESFEDGKTVNPHCLRFSLTPVSSMGSVCLPFDMTISSLYELDPVAPVSDDHHDNPLSAWQHEIEVHCEWLTPPHVAKLPFVAYEPFTFSHLESSAGNNTFLQLTMVNSCPLPLILIDHTLNTPLKLVPLAGQKPEIFYPGDSFSFLWQHHKVVGNVEVFGTSKASFKIDYHPREESKLSRTAKYNFKLSNMETIYQLQSSIESLIPNQPVITGQTVLITYTITNITRDFRDSTQEPGRLQYVLHPDRAYWDLTSTLSGVVEAPRIAQKVSFKVAATPKQAGFFCAPSCSLTLEQKPRVEGSDGVEIEQEVLTGAQCYNTCEWEYVQVLENSAY